MEFNCYQLEDRVPEIVPAGFKRGWMDKSENRSAYRCTPMIIANSSGWEILLPRSFRVHWNGGPKREDIQIEALDDSNYFKYLATSHFGGGVLTFLTGYLFQTSLGWTVSVRGAPNWPKDGVTALEGLIESDWLPFPFAMNWLFTRPGTVEFLKGEPYCFITPVPQLDLEYLVPKIHSIKSNPELHGEFQAWKKSRKDFNDKLFQHDQEALKKGWQRNYVNGKTMLGTSSSPYHKTKLRVPDPIIVDSIASRKTVEERSKDR
ncbi:DUF6065 family protein [Lentilitoribacter sp. EG35]|uniref:DUF6065 family protein n=1 Tax=Lentilitoribacter sp. EG35 TaxID=3234192 RepID=UPI00345FB5FF